MTKQSEKFSLENLDSDIRLTLEMLRGDIKHLEKLLAAAKSDNDERELAIRREIRPLAVELLYFVIGTPKTMKEVLDEMEKQEDEDGE